VNINPLLNLMRAPNADELVELTVTPFASTAIVCSPLAGPVPYSFAAEAEKAMESAPAVEFGPTLGRRTPSSNIATPCGRPKLTIPCAIANALGLPGRTAKSLTV
jgi:hypothetical protein